MSIYKYIGADVGALFFENWSISFVAPINFNDPFDCHPGFLMRTPTERESRIEVLKKRTDWDDRSRQKYAEIFEELEGKDHLRTVRNLITRSTFRISCFTRTKNHLLMWSHYAKAHTGLLIGFREDSIIFQERLKPVIYSDARPQFPLFKEFRLSNILSKETCLVKGLEWAYEQELRMILNNREISELPSVVSQQIAVPWLVKLEKSDVEVIVFGCRYSYDEMKTISKTLLEDSSTSHIKLFRAEPDQYEYKLNYVPIAN
jgi:hypothetical protein